MKTLLRFFGLGLIGGLSLNGFDANATLEVSASVQISARADFDAPLAAYGTWGMVGSYGRCWHPEGVAAGWRPYCDGEWVWTDCGWYWESDEPWAWACYHYGRWVFDSETGWVWIPDVEWAPAWVEWRVGGGFIGWAPCGPPGVVIAPGFFGFVELNHFHERVRPSMLVVNNSTIINKTKVINNVRKETRTIGGSSRRVFVNEGPGVNMVQKATGKRISAVPVQEAARRTVVPPAVINRRVQPGNREKAPIIQDQRQKSKNIETPRLNPESPRMGEPPRTPPRTERPPSPNLEPPAKSIIPNERPAPRINETPRLNPEPPRIERPPGATLEPPARSPAPSERPAREQIVPPAGPQPGEHVVTPERPVHPPEAPPANRGEPPGGGGSKGQPREKGDGHDKP